MSDTRGLSLTETLARSIGFRLSRLARLRRVSWEHELLDLDLSPGEAATLRALGDGEAEGLRALARTLGQDPMTLKRCVDRLESRGLVESVAGEDRRLRSLRVTRTGRRLAETVTARALERDAVIARVLGPEDLATFEGLLARLETHLTDPPEDSHVDF